VQQPHSAACWPNTQPRLTVAGQCCLKSPYPSLCSISSKATAAAAAAAAVTTQLHRARPSFKQTIYKMFPSLMLHH